MQHEPVEPDFRFYAPLPEIEGDDEHGSTKLQAVVQSKMKEIQIDHDGAWFRMTLVSDEYPKEGYPHGLYLEGWKTRPIFNLIEAEFSFPIVDGKVQLDAE